MKSVLDIITITKDDPEGVASTILSTRKLRAFPGVRQLIIDSSGEQTREKIEDLLADEENVEYVWQKPSGIASAFNLGIDSARSEWLWFLNGRDEVHPDIDSQTLLYLLSNGKSDIMIFELEFMESRTRHKHPPLWRLWPPFYPNWVPHPATLIRRELFEKYGKFSHDYSIAMDGEAWVRFFSKDIVTDMISIPIVLYDECGISSTQAVQIGREVKKIIKTHFFTLLKIWLNRGIHLVRTVMHYVRLTRSL